MQLTLNNVIRWIMADAVQTATTNRANKARDNPTAVGQVGAADPPLRPVHLKFLDAKRLILSVVPAMTAAPTIHLPSLYRTLLHAIARHRILVRPGRRYRRKGDTLTRYKGHGRFAHPAQLPTTTETTQIQI